MTKARTVAEAKRSRRGRPRDEAPRWKCGKKNPTPQRLEDDPRYPAWNARARLMGWSLERGRDHERNIRRANDQRLATLYGRLHVADMLSQDAHDGLAAYAALTAAYLREIDAPPPYPRCIDLSGALAGKSPLLASDTADTKKAAHGAATAILRQTGFDALSCCVMAVNAGEDVAPASIHPRIVMQIEFGGRALARHFGLRL